MMKNEKGKAGGFYLSVLAGILLVAALVRYYSFGGITENGVQIQFVGPVAAAVLLVVLSFFADNSLFVVAEPVLAAAALAVFLTASINILTGYIFNLAMFGDVTMIGPVMQVSCMIGAAILLLIISSFLKRNRADE